MDALSVGITQKKVNWVLDLDIRSFFDRVEHEWMVQFVEHRIADTRIVRPIQKWLKAAVREEGRWFETKEGTPQGSVISLLLANLYLYYVLDVWVKVWREKVARGEMIIVRYADDAMLGFQLREDAERLLEQLRDGQIVRNTEDGARLCWNGELPQEEVTCIVWFVCQQLPLFWEALC